MQIAPDVTVLIAARNAAATIGRAIRSVTSQGPYPIILVDDFSTDDTVTVARRAAGRQVTVVRPPRHESLGLTRQTGLDAVTTHYTMLLDADDELLPGRIKRMQKALDHTGLDIFTDPLALHDGATGCFIRDLPIPDFLTKSPVPIRLFERNYLPGIGQLGFVTALAQGVGYDKSLHGPEDIDLALRMLLAGGQFYYEKEIGYRMYAYPDSVSRDLDNQRKMYSHCLKKFSYETIHALYIQHGRGERISLWGLVSIALFREEYRKALTLIDRISAIDSEVTCAVLEPEGPQPFSEEWRLAFHRGTSLLLLGNNEEAAVLLERARTLRTSPETLNNLAVAYGRLSRFTELSSLFKEALTLYPDYLDARHNLSARTPERITTHPLRLQANRCEYCGFDKH